MNTVVGEGRAAPCCSSRVGKGPYKTFGVKPGDRHGSNLWEASTVRYELKMFLGLLVSWEFVCFIHTSDLYCPSLST